MGIENLQKVVGFGLQLGEAILSAVSQSSALSRAAAMLPLLEDVPALLGVDYSQLGAEVKNLSPADLDALNVYIDANFSIPDADKQAKVEAAISVVIDLAKVAEKAVSVWQAKSSVATSVVVPSATATP